MTQSSYPNQTILYSPKGHLIFFAVFCSVMIWLFQPHPAAANVSTNFQNGIEVADVDTSKLSPSHPIVTVKITNHGSTPSGNVQLKLSYLPFPTDDHGKSWKTLNQLNFVSEFDNLATLPIQSLASGETQEIDVSLQPYVVATFNRIPAIFIGEIFLEGESTPLDHQVGLAFPKQISLVHTTALAFDNPQFAVGNLAPQIEETVNGLIRGSRINTEVFSIALFDDYGDGDTQIFFIYSGIIIPARSLFSGLPDVNGNLLTEISEYDMGDGETLGGYLKWVRQITHNHKVAFSFYGHGGALMPEIEPQAEELIDSSPLRGSSPVTMPSWVLIQPSWVLIQPSWVLIQPSWVLIQPSSIVTEGSLTTDSHPVSIVSVKDLATALKKGTNNGENPIEVVDLVHCFSLSIEEVYELAPYAKNIIGSANYHFFDTRMPGQALANLDADSSAEAIATTMMATYDNVLPSEGYPRTMAVISGEAVADIKRYWDQTSAALLSAFDRDHQTTREKLQQAYLASTKYDSTSCDNEFDLNSPDALVDFYEFSSQIENLFSDDLSVVQSAQLTSAQIDAAVVSVINRSGIPWFGTSIDDSWQFTGKGLSIYADLVGLPDEDGRYALSWQSAFYNRVPHEHNPSPFDFVASGNQQPTWSDVIQRSWEGFEISAQGCVVSIPLDQDEAEVTLSNVVRVTDEAESGNMISADFYVDRPIGNLVVLFEIMRADEVIYSERVHSGWLDAGHQSISTKTILDISFFEAKTHDEQIAVTIDPDGFISEMNKDDNHLIVPIH